jgi:hypothetical protein
MGWQLPFWRGALPGTGSKPGQQRFFAGADFFAVVIFSRRLLARLIDACAAVRDFGTIVNTGTNFYDGAKSLFQRALTGGLLLAARGLETDSPERNFFDLQLLTQAEADGAFGGGWIDDAAVLGDDDLSGGDEAAGCGTGWLHEPLPCDS